MQQNKNNLKKAANEITQCSFTNKLNKIAENTPVIGRTVLPKTVETKHQQRLTIKSRCKFLRDL